MTDLTNKKRTSSKTKKADPTSDLLKIYQSMSEHEHQREFFQWTNVVKNWGVTVADAWVDVHPEMFKRPGIQDFAAERGLSAEPNDLFRWLHAIPNGGSRGGTKTQRQVNGGRLKAEGVKAGVADIFWPKGLGGFNGLYIELKRIGKSKTEPEQIEFRDYCGQNNFAWHLCKGYLEAISVLRAYAKL